MTAVALIAPDALPVLSPDHARYGGSEAVIWNLAEGLARRGYPVTLFAKTGSEAPAGVRLVTTPSVQAILQEHADDLLSHAIVHDHSWSLLAWKLAERRPDRHWIMTWHGPTLGPAIHWNPPPPNLTVCGVSAWHARMLAAELGVPLCQVDEVTNVPPRVVATPNGIDLDRYPLYTGPREDYLLYLARLAPEKGLHLAMALAEAWGMPLKVAGTEHLVSDPAYVQAMLRRMDGHTVTYLGDLGGEAKVAAIQHARMVLVPAWSFPEPFGLYAVEALACGTPVLTWTSGAVADIVGARGFAMREVEDMRLRQFVSDLPRPVDCRAQAERYGRDPMLNAIEQVYRLIDKEDLHYGQRTQSCSI